MLNTKNLAIRWIIVFILIVSVLWLSYGIPKILDESINNNTSSVWKGEPNGFKGVEMKIERDWTNLHFDSSGTTNKQEN